MFSSSVFIYVLTLSLSFSIGFLYYYVMTTDTSKNKRARLDVLSAHLINFILYIWLAKILIRMPTFLKDPLAVLAYPSNATAFSVATVFIFIHIFVKFRNDKEKWQHLLQTFIPVFIVAQFLYEFIQGFGIGLKPNLIQLVFYMVLTILYTVLKGKVTEVFLRRIIVPIWLVGQPIISIFSSPSILGYLVGILYFIGLSILALGIMVYSNKRNKLNT